jgi:nucleotidyltransferase/DNA polymerase involved in DNA repair
MDTPWTPDFACVSIPEFPAWAFARTTTPDRDVIVVHAGCVVASTRGARRLGVREGMSVDRARVLAPAAPVRVRDPQLEAAAWEAVAGDLLATTPCLETLGPGTALLGRPDEAALRRVVAELGARAACAPDRGTARLGAARAAAGHVLSIGPSDRRAFLTRFAVERLGTVGVDADIVASLQLFGYHHLAAVATLTERQLKAQYGREGVWLYDLLNPPKEERPVAPFQPPPSIAASVELDPPCREPGELLPAIDHVVEEAACSLDTVYARRVAVRLRCGGEEVKAVRVLPEAVRSAAALGRTARALLVDLLREEREVERLCVELGGLGPATLAQTHLFHRRPSVYLAVRGVHRRFPGAIRRAVIVEALFPEQAARLEPFPEVAA